MRARLPATMLFAIFFFTFKAYLLYDYYHFTYITRARPLITPLIDEMQVRMPHMISSPVLYRSRAVPPYEYAKAFHVDEH